jgi:organic hydroperoxide reductase OsmC/OhrA
MLDDVAQTRPTMNEHTFVTALHWQRTNTDFTYETYDRSHVVMSGSGVNLPSSSAPAFRGDPARINPEEMLLAALSSCHMLTFLAVAAKKRFIVDSYDDDATAVMTKNADGKLAVTRAVLRPRIVFSGEHMPTAADIALMHAQAHHGCFIANSVHTEVVVDDPTQHVHA